MIKVMGTNIFRITDAGRMLVKLKKTRIEMIGAIRFGALFFLSIIVVLLLF